MADEVYQENIYTDRPFLSFKKIVKEMKLDTFELFSFHSTSKGFVGECGKRGGYFECHGIDEAVLGELYKVSSIGLCPNTDGQLMTSLMVNPPKHGQESFELYQQEINQIKTSLERKAAMITETLNGMEGVSCTHPQGALYIFPLFLFPQRFVNEAKSIGQQPDELYAMRLLEATGICVIPGSGFDQKEATFHIRIAFLPSEALFPKFTADLAHFHSAFIEQYKK